MSIQKMNNSWSPSFIDPSATRFCKPRHTGVTMVMDKGLGLTQFTDLLQTTSEYIDFIKLGFGTSALYPPAILHEKIQRAQQHQVTVYPGGTFFELAYVQGKMEEYFAKAQEWGFDTVEISDGSIHLTRAERDAAILTAKKIGLHVISECGKKASGSSIEEEEMKHTLTRDLECGAKYMLIEGRESGNNVGIYDANGQIDARFIHKIKQTLGDFKDVLIWEAPQKHQQVTLIKSFGTNVNLGNIPPQEVFSLESLRRGLRSDTFSGQRR